MKPVFFILLIFSSFLRAMQGDSIEEIKDSLFWLDHALGVRNASFLSSDVGRISFEKIQNLIEQLEKNKESFSIHNNPKPLSDTLIEKMLSHRKILGFRAFIFAILGVGQGIAITKPTDFVSLCMNAGIAGGSLICFLKTVDYTKMIYYYSVLIKSLQHLSSLAGK